MSLRKKYYNPSDERDAEELLNYLDSIDSDDDSFEQIKDCRSIDLTLCPPRDGLDSDIDDAPSDDEGISTIRDLGRGVLRQPLEIAVINNQAEKYKIQLGNTSQEVQNSLTLSSSDDDLPLAKRFKIQGKSKRKKASVVKIKRDWRQKQLRNIAEKIKIDKTSEPSIVERIRNHDWQPIDLFKLFFDENFIKCICDETQKYAILKGKHDFTVSITEMYVYIGILLLSGYCKVPFRRMFWETKTDAHNLLVSNSISRDRFESIHRFLHFNDNNNLDPNNRLYKVSPLCDHINQLSQQLAEPLGMSFSLDEAMEPYFGRHSMKQFIKGKPIRYGFKFWCLTTSEGYLLKFNPYCGAGDKVEGKTLGSSVTEKLCVGYIPPNSTVYLDNFFNSLPLLDYLKSKSINCVGTIRADRIEKAPLKDLKKENRGSTHVLQDSKTGITVIRWHDNSQVSMGTNVINVNLCLSKGSCKRWSKAQRKTVDVDQPTLINLYNQGMGGVDLFDKMRGLYRIRIRSKKWYWPYVRFCLNGAVVNMWMLYRYVYPKTSLLKFIREVVLSILTAPEHVTGPKPKRSKNVLKAIRYDTIDHLIDKQATQRRCAYCGKCTKFSCSKCNVGLHP